MNLFHLALSCAKGLAETLKKELSLHGYNAKFHNDSLVSIEGCQFQDLVYLNEYIHCAETVEIILFQTQLMESPEEFISPLEGLKFIDFFQNQRTFGVKGIRSGKHSFNSVAISRAVATGITKSLLKDDLRPRANLKSPDLEFFARLYDQDFLLTLNTTGVFQSDSMTLPYKHVAPLKRTLAAGLLLNSSFLNHGLLFDPMCGGGTIGLEAVWLIKQTPLSTIRKDQFAFRSHHYNQDSVVPKSRFIPSTETLGLILGDSSRNKIKGAIENFLSFDCKDFARFYRGNAIKMAYLAEGRAIPSLIVNPPYGIRVKNTKDVDQLYEDFSLRCKALKLEEVVAITPRKRAWIKAFENQGYSISLTQAVDFSGLPTSIIKAQLI